MDISAMSFVARHMVVATGFILVACGTSPEAKDGFESYAASLIGKTRSSLDARVECADRDAGYGCMRTDPRNCRVWFAVDRASDKITGWQYEEPKDTMPSVKETQGLSMWGRSGR